MVDQESSDDTSYKSKSQVKREMLALQDLGEKLTSLNKDQLKRLDLPVSLFEAINECKKITSRSAKRRQLQYIGRLMRELEDTSFIEQFLEQIEMKDSRVTAIHHMLEAWRDKLLSEDDASAITAFISQYPHTDRQHFRQLIKNAKKERELGKPAGACKLLYQYLKKIQKPQS